jgi:hypothetical protein
MLEDALQLYKDRVLLVLDACQCRSEPEELDWFLQRGGLVLVTASKFYGAPGFCGAVLVPEAASKHLEEEVEAPAGLRDYITRYEVPRSMTKLYNALPSGPKNIGLLLRWTCGVTEMEQFAMAGTRAKIAIGEWVAGVRKLVCDRRPALDLLESDCDTACAHRDMTRAGGVNSVVSIKFLANCGTRHIDATTLKQVHRWMTQDMSAALPAHATKAERAAAALRCFVGQPVQMGSFGVLRLAISAPLARHIAEDPAHFAEALTEDGRVLDKMIVLTRHCEYLKKGHDTAVHKVAERVAAY